MTRVLLWERPMTSETPTPAEPRTEGLLMLSDAALPASASIALFPAYHRATDLGGKPIRVLGIAIGPVEDRSFTYGLHDATAYLCRRADGATFWMSQRNVRFEPSDD
jgi:hypothetical protein